MNRDRRKTYRVALRPCERLLITIHPDKGLPLLGDVVDLNIEGAGATFSVLPPPLPLGERVCLSLSTRGGPRPIELLATVVARSDEKRVRRYGLQFLEPALLHNGLGQRLFRLFNRRGQIRISMDGSPAAVRAEGRSDPITHKAALHDLSVGGLALAFAPEAESDLRSASRLLVRFRLSEETPALQVVARVRSRRMSPEGLIYGLEFDAAKTRHFPEIQDRVIQLLRLRETEELTSSDELRPAG